MIDNFALALSHGLILLMAWRLLSRADLDDDSGKKRQTFAARDAAVPDEADLPGA